MDKQETNGSVEIEGKTIDEAIQKGLKELDLRRDQVEVKILNEGSAGLFGLMGSKPAKVKLQRKQGVRASGPQDGRIKELVEDFTRKLLELMLVKDAAVEGVMNDGELVVRINTADNRDSALLIGKSGKTLSSMEMVIQSIVSHNLMGKGSKDDQARLRVVVDINDYRLRQEEKLKETIAEAVGIVKKTRREYSFEPMSARSRRLIHLAVQEHEELETVSEGEGRDRKVVLKLKKSG